MISIMNLRIMQQTRQGSISSSAPLYIAFLLRQKLPVAFSALPLDRLPAAAFASD